MPLPLYGSGGLTFRISAAIWPTRCLSMPRTTIVPGFGTSNSIPSRGLMVTGCEYPTCRWMSCPCNAPRYPTPCIWSVLVKPSVTPVTAFWSKERVSPCIALSRGASESRSTTMLASSCLTSTPRPTGTVSSPLGPLTLTLPAEMSTSTLSGTSMGALPILDIPHHSLIDEAEYLAADAGAPGLVVGEDAPGGREDCYPEAVQHAGNAGLFAVDAPTRSAHAPQARDPTFSLGPVLELDNELLLRAGTLLGGALYVALLLEDAGHLGLHPRVRHLDRLVLGHPRVTDAGQKVRYGIVNAHPTYPLPTRLRDPGDLPLVRQLPEADPAQTEPPQVRARPAALLAPVVLPDLELLRLPLLDHQRFSRHRLMLPS